MGGQFMIIASLVTLLILAHMSPSKRRKHFVYGRGVLSTKVTELSR